MKKRNPNIIDIPKPCNEMWDEMTPNEHGRFCNACQKTVTDYTQMSDQQLLDIIKRGSMGCGRFLNTQLNRELVPERRQWQFFSSTLIKKIAASLLVLQAFTHSAQAQTSTGEIRGRVTDNHHEPVAGAVIQVKSGNRVVGGAATDMNGNYEIKPLEAGYYTIVTSKPADGYKISTVHNVVVATENPVVVDFTLTAIPPKNIEEPLIRGGVPLVDTRMGDYAPKIIDEKDISKMGGPMVSRDELYATTPNDIYLQKPKKNFWQRINIFRRRHHYR